MAAQQAGGRPIGFWVKRVDALLTGAINQALRTHGLTRSAWQVLSLIQQAGHLSQGRMLAEMGDFVTGDALDEVLAALQQRRWAVSVGQGEVVWTLTEAGQHGYEAALRTQSQVRQRATAGISAEDYGLVIEVLGRIVSNLEGADGGVGDGAAGLDAGTGQ